MQVRSSAAGDKLQTTPAIACVLAGILMAATVFMQSADKFFQGWRLLVAFAVSLCGIVCGMLGLLRKRRRALLRADRKIAVCQLLLGIGLLIFIGMAKTELSVLKYIAAIFFSAAAFFAVRAVKVATSE